MLEEFLGSGHPLANAWIDAVAATFPELPRYIALTRNVTVFRTLEWMIARRAGRLLTGKPSPALQMTDPEVVPSAHARGCRSGIMTDADDA